MTIIIIIMDILKLVTLNRTLILFCEELTGWLAGWLALRSRSGTTPLSSSSLSTPSSTTGEQGWMDGLNLEVYLGSVGHGVQYVGHVTEYHAVPVHYAMCKYTIIPSSPCPTEDRVPLNQHIPLDTLVVISARLH